MLRHELVKSIETESLHENLTVLPHVYPSDLAILSVVHAAFDIALFEKNYARIQESRCVPRATAKRMKNACPGFRAAFSAERHDPLHALQGGGIREVGTTTRSGLDRHISKTLAQAREPFALSAANHGVEAQILTALKEQNPSAIIASVVFDRHLDFMRRPSVTDTDLHTLILMTLRELVQQNQVIDSSFSTSPERIAAEIHALKESNGNGSSILSHNPELLRALLEALHSPANMLDATTMYDKLLNSNTIACAAFFGANPTLVTAALSDTRSILELVKSEYGDRIYFPHQGAVPKLSSTQIEHDISRMLRNFRAYGVTHLVPSVDMDVVAGVDAVRYSEWNNLLVMGVQEFPEEYDFSGYNLGEIIFLSREFARLAIIFETVANKNQALLDPQYLRNYAVGKEISEESIAVFCAGRKSIFERLSTEGKGLQLQQLIEYLKTLKRMRDHNFPEISIGVPVSAGGIYSGGIFELFGTDDIELTASLAAKKIARTLQEITTPHSVQ